jgi:hypothetical protein
MFFDPHHIHSNVCCNLLAVNSQADLCSLEQTTEHCKRRYGVSMSSDVIEKMPSTGSLTYVHVDELSVW